MRFIITAQAGTANTTAKPEADFDEQLFAAYMRLNEEMHLAGVLAASEGLDPAAKSARVAVSQCNRRVVEGPFAESERTRG